jgi:hypothetical protein
MLARLGATAAIAAALLITAAPAGAAGGWRTAAFGEDRERGEYAYLYFDLQTSLLGVHGLRVTTSTTTRGLEIGANVECDRGETAASRRITIRVPAGRTTRPLPLPVAGGHCDVRLGVTAETAGDARVTLQLR